MAYTMQSIDRIYELMERLATELTNNGVLSNVDETLTALIDKANTLMAVLNAELTTANSTISTQSSEITTLNQSISDKDTQIDTLDSSLSNMTSKYNNVKELSSKLIERSSTSMDLILPEDITQIGQYAFYGMSVNCISFPKNLIYIGPYAFEYFYSRNNVYLRDTQLKTIGAYAFYGYTGGTIFLPGTVTTIENNAFMNLPSGTIIYCESAEVVALFIDGVNYDASTTDVKVPGGHVGGTNSVPETEGPSAS